ncbi:MAG: dTDP-4-dehydrorhamnose 3,5-epimerase [Candidatus Andersenbacteria bacterium]|nr:dTDP-4-dehydrorhamnose 3,5-epimerase [Candidatus Andersenbacteria bacterium]
MPFTFEKLDIPEVLHITPLVFSDERGAFSELFKASEFSAHGIPDLFVQVNQSVSAKGVLRGLHYQKQPSAQGKLVSVAHGEIFDVAVDIRQGSPTYGKWIGQALSAKVKNMLYIPIGFAHGFYVLSESAELVYFCTNEYAKEQEAGIIWNDPAIGITWPGSEPLVSAKDAALPLLEKCDNNFQYE